MGKTTQVASDRAFDQSKTVLPAEVARGVYMRNAPSLQALKLMHLMIGIAAGRMADDVAHKIRLSDIRLVEGMRNHDRDSLTRLFQELSAAVLTHDDPEKMVVTIGGLLDEAKVDYSDESAGDLLITWWFRRTFRNMAAESNHWAVLDRQTAFHLGSKYSMLLFQHIASYSQYKHIRSKVFTVAELRAIFGLSVDKLVRFSHLNDRVIKPAVEEISQLSRFDLTATPRKVGRTVVSVEISWREKGADRKLATKRELDSSKVGRKARRDGSVENVEGIEICFPDRFIRHTPFAEIARANLPEPMRDIDLVAGEFRAWAKRENKPLRGERVLNMFAGFCRSQKPAD